MRKLIKTIKWRLEYLTGKPQPWHTLPVIDIADMVEGDILYFKSGTNPRDNGIWVVK